MENRILKYFLVVAREENITHASEILHISQPALSRQLMQLEEELGVKLFVRGRRSVTLTEEGAYLRQRAQEIVDLTEKTEQEFRCGRGALNGVIGMGMGETAASFYIADAVHEFAADYPDVRFDIQACNADDAKEQLDKGLLDIGVLLEPVDVSKYEFFRLPVKDSWGVLLPADSALARQESVTAADLRGEKLFASRRAIAQSMLSSWFGKYFNEKNVYLTYNLIYNAAVFAEKGMGAALAIEGAVSLFKNPRLVFRPLYPALEQTSVFIWKKHKLQSPSIAKFIDFIKCKSVMTNDKK